jgi:hypothetical protein
MIPSADAQSPTSRKGREKWGTRAVRSYEPYLVRGLEVGVAELPKQE